MKNCSRHQNRRVFGGTLAAAMTILVFANTVGHAQELPDRDVSYTSRIEFTVKEHGDAEYALSSEVAVEVRLLSPRAAKTASFMVPEPFFAPIKKLKVKVNSSSVSSDRIAHGADSWSDVFLTGHQRYTVYLPSDLKTGDVVSYSYQEQYSDIAFLPILFVPNIDSLKEYSVVFKHPDDVRVEFEFYFPRDTVPYLINRSEGDETSLSFRGPAYDEDRKFLTRESYHAAVLCRFTRGEKSINPVQPGEYVDWYYRNTSRSPGLDSTHHGMFNPRLAGKRTILDTLATIHDFVRTTIRYVADERGLNCYIPHSPSSTLATQFGDCKDRVALIAGIAGEYGIRTLTVLVPGGNSPVFNGVNAEMFNHVISAFQLGPRLLYFDPTAKYCEFGNLPDNDVGKRVFVMGTDGGRFETIPLPSREPSLDVTIDGRLDSTNVCRAGIVLRNDFLAGALHARHDLTEEKFILFLKSLVSDNLYQVRLDSFKVVGEENGIMRIGAQGDLSKFILESGDKYYVPRTPFARFDNDILEREKDRYELSFAATTDLKLQLVVHSAGIEVQPETTQVGREPFLFAASAARDGKGARFDYRYSRNIVTVRPEEKQAFISNYKAYLENKRNVFVMTRRKP